MNAIAKLATTVLSAGSLAYASAAQAKDFRVTVVAGHSDVFVWVKLLDDHFIPEVDRRLAATPHKIAWTRAYGGTLAKLGGEVEAIGDGVAGMGIVSTAFSAGKLPLVQVGYMAPFGSDDPYAATKVVDDLHDTVPAMRKMWDLHNLSYLAGGAVDSYLLMTKKPILTLDDLRGLKIGAPGPAANWLSNTGAVAVAGSLAVYYNELKTGVYDGVIVFSTAAAPAKLHEVAPFVTRASLGAVYVFGLVVNKDAWAGFPQEVRAAFTAAADGWRTRLADAQRQRADAALQTMAANGATIATLHPGERKRWAEVLPNLGARWADDLEKKGMPGRAVLTGYMNGIRQTGVAYPRDWDR